MLDTQLTRNAFGQLVFTDDAGGAHVGVTPVRAFALTAPDKGLALVGPSGHELLWIDQLSDLPATARSLIEAELAGREFMPTVTRIRHVSSFATPSTWEVDTDRGATELVLKGEEDIRRLHLYGPDVQSLIIADSHGVQFFVPDRAALDRHSKKLLERFL